MVMSTCIGQYELYAIHVDARFRAYFFNNYALHSLQSTQNK